MVEVVQQWNEELDALHRQIAPRFRRAEPGVVAAAMCRHSLAHASGRTVGRLLRWLERPHQMACSACRMPLIGMPISFVTTFKPTS